MKKLKILYLIIGLMVLGLISPLKVNAAVGDACPPPCTLPLVCNHTPGAPVGICGTPPPTVSPAAAAPGAPTCTSDTGIPTAIGCIPISNFNAFAGTFLRIGIGIGGGIGFLFIVYAGFILTTSSGDPKRVQAGKELFGAALGGILLLIFSVFILRLVGVNILGIL